MSLPASDKLAAATAGIKRLAPYQVDVVAHPWFKPESDGGMATKLAVEKARRIGLSEAAAIRALFMCLGRMVQPDGTFPEFLPGTREPVPAMSGIIISKDYAAARGVIAKIAANVLELAKAGDVECQKAQIGSSIIRFPTRGTEVRALAGQGSTIRSWTGFVILDEFAFVRNQEDVYGAASPVADSNWGAKRGYPMLFITTPWAEGTLAHRVHTDPSMGIAQMSFDIRLAKAQGFPIDIDQKFKELGIPELIETEYLCIWGRGGGSFFPLSKLLACKRDDGTERRIAGSDRIETFECVGLPQGWERALTFYGIDVGHGVGRDFTAIVQYRLLEDEYWITGVKAFNHLGYDEQLDELVPWIRKAPGEVLVDAGYGGKFLIDGLKRRLSGVKGCPVTGVHLDSKKQEALAIRLRRLIDNDQLRIYTGDAAGGDLDGYHPLILELAQIKGKMGASGRLQLETPRDELRGHCDRAWAAMVGMAGRIGGAAARPLANDVQCPPPGVTDIDSAGIF